ncbi:MAG: NUDIX domain-containing protein [Candidatus Staskawiczbacteria bacterium]|nr:NUDIX domain-containing protein [Candidatus Staskawiczbacteria bacterium]
MVFLQKRGIDALNSPDYFGLFGGHAEEGENPEQTLKREIKEELDFDLEKFEYFRKYEYDDMIMDIFFMAVPDNFEEKITVNEGQYGKWLTEQEFLSEEKTIKHDKSELIDLFKYIKEKYE